MKENLYWMNYSIKVAEKSKQNNLRVGIVLVDKNNKLIFSADNINSWILETLNIIKNNSIKTAKSLFLTINTIDVNNNFDLNKILDLVKIKNIYIGLPDPSLDIYLNNDPVISKNNIYRYPDDLQKEIYCQNKIFYVNSNQSLKNCSFYSNNRISKIISNKLKKEGYIITEDEIKSQKNLNKLASYISKKYSITKNSSIKLITNIVSISYDEKYSSYNYKDDVRSINPNWKDNYIKIHSKYFNKPIDDIKIINVGVGSGNEASVLFAKVKNITFADIAKECLNKINNLLPNSNTVKCRAEELSSFVNNDFDLYISLRTYNSSLFDTSRAIREAYNVLNNNGVFIISISNGFLSDKSKKIIPGLIIPKIDFVDLYRGLDIIKKIKKELHYRKFENIIITPTNEEIFISAQKNRKEFLIMNNDILKYCEKLANVKINNINNYIIINPYNGKNKDTIKKVTAEFYNKFYNDTNKRYLILGSNPARKGTALTGVPYEDAKHLYDTTGILIEGFNINKSSSNFLYDVIENYGGSQKFYGDFYMNFVFPLGIAKINNKGNEINSNYYENKNLQKQLYSYIIESIQEILKFNIDRSICFCIGSGENYKFLLNINNKYGFFEKIVPLQHPRFIMQYNSKDKDLYLKKYLEILNNK